MRAAHTHHRGHVERPVRSNVADCSAMWTDCQTVDRIKRYSAQFIVSAAANHKRKRGP
jgi:hypothetical protein